MRDALVGLICVPTIVVATIKAWQEQIEWGLKIGSLALAAAASLAMLLYYRDKRRKLDRSRSPWGGE